jgi:hypothetical protein
MKKKLALGIAILSLMILLLTVALLTKFEKKLVVLKCVHQIEENKEKKNLTNYYKITSRLHEDHPHKLYISNPNYEEKDSPPYLIGISIQNASDLDKSFIKRRPYLPPDWYTFIPQREYGGFIVPTATYINRVTMKMEDLSLEDGMLWSSGNCAIVQAKEFDDDYRSQIENKKKEQKF